MHDAGKLSRSHMHTGGLAVPHPCRLSALCQAWFHFAPRHSLGVFQMPHWLMQFWQWPHHQYALLWKESFPGKWIYQQLSVLSIHTAGSLYGFPGAGWCIYYTTYDGSESLMLHLKFHWNWSISSRKYYFTIYGHGGHLGHVAGPVPFIQTLVPPF